MYPAWFRMADKEKRNQQSRVQSNISIETLEKNTSHNDSFCDQLWVNFWGANYVANFALQDSSSSPAAGWELLTHHSRRNDSLHLILLKYLLNVLSIYILFIKRSFWPSTLVLLDTPITETIIFLEQESLQTIRSRIS